MDSKIVLKMKYGDDLRRVSLDLPISIKVLFGVVQEVFHLQEQYTIKYVDEDNDYISLGSDLELHEALNVAKQQGSILRLFIFDQKKPATQSKPDEKGQPSQSVPPVFPFGNLFNDPNFINPLFSQLFANPQLFNLVPQVLSTLSANPQVLNTIPQLVQSVVNQLNNVPGSNTNNNNNANADVPKEVADLLQALGLGNNEGVKNLIQPFLNSPLLKELLPHLLTRFNALNPGSAAQPTSTPPTTPSTPTTPSAAVHVGVTCDGCNQSPITGIRFKCGNCSDYDLCESCESKRPHNEEHVFLKIYKPIHLRSTTALLPELYKTSDAVPTTCGNDVPRCPRKRNQGLSSKFMADITIPDGSETECGSKFSKTWRMKNDGSASWPEGTVLKFVGGVVTSDSATVPVKSLNAGEEIDISVSMTAPTIPGRYISYFRLCTPDGIRFGHRIWVDFIAITKPEPQPVVFIPEPQPITTTIPVPQPEPTELSKQALLDICMEEDMKTLAAMGFIDREKTKRLWKESKGDMTTIIAKLLSNN